MIDTGEPLIWSVSDFVAVLNQTLEFAYPSVIITGELVNFRISKNKWVYFDLKDEQASVRCFGTVYTLPGPLEDGMALQIRAVPRLHPQFGFSLSIQSIQPVGEGSIKRAVALLEVKLTREGLFDEARKRPLLYPPLRIGLITSSESAAYADFIKILNERWGGIDIQLADVQVQGELAATQIIEAVELFNQTAQPPEVLVITRGGGSAEDLQVFNTEAVTRAVAASRIPTLVAIGHEIDTSLAEKAADKRASTPSNAAELLVPNKKHELILLTERQLQLIQYLNNLVLNQKRAVINSLQQLSQLIKNHLIQEKNYLKNQAELLLALSPQAALRRGYAILRNGGDVIRFGKQVKVGESITAEIIDARLTALVKNIRLK